jgi:tRNA nucleotidyltransferase (CCA-adding enzyme)
LKTPDASAFRAALDEPNQAVLDALVSAADAQELALYAVGGPVRDLLLGRALRDVDLLLVGEVEPLLDSAALSGARVARHERFRTWRLSSPGAAVDIAQARRESYAHPGALPRVEPGTLEEDLARRDFSINALALPISKLACEAHPKLIEVDGGLADLKRRQLRIQHRRSFLDDPTRAVRAARLAVRLDFSLSRGSRSALRDALRDGAFGRVSGDRLRREWVRLVDEAHLGVDPSRVLRLLADWHVLAALEPGLGLAREAVTPLRRIGRAVASPPWRAPRWRPWASAMAVWLAPLAPALRRRTLRRLSVRGDVATHIAGFAKAHEGWLRALAKARGRGAVDAILAPLSDEDLHALYVRAEPKARRRISRWAIEDRVRRLPIGGDDLVAIGLQGPAVGRALTRIRTAFLDGAVSDRDAAIALAHEIARRAKRSKGKRA